MTTSNQTTPESDGGRPSQQGSGQGKAPITPAVSNERISRGRIQRVKAPQNAATDESVVNNIIELISADLAKAQQTVTPLREHLLQLNSEENKNALGVKSLRRVFAKYFPQDAKLLYRQHNAACVEQMLGVAIGSHRESVLRPLTSKHFDDEARKSYYNEAMRLVNGDLSKLTARHVSKTIQGSRSEPENTNDHDAGQVNIQSELSDDVDKLLYDALKDMEERKRTNHLLLLINQYYHNDKLEDLIVEMMTYPVSTYKSTNLLINSIKEKCRAKQGPRKTSSINDNKKTCISKS